MTIDPRQRKRWLGEACWPFPMLIPLFQGQHTSYWKHIRMKGKAAPKESGEVILPPGLALGHVLRDLSPQFIH